MLNSIMKTLWLVCKPYVIFLCQILMLTLLFITLNACYWIFPKLYYYIAGKVGEISRMAMVVKCQSDYADHLVTWQAYRVIVRSMLSHTKKQVNLLSPAINVSVISETTGHKNRLLAYSNPGRPLIISFGSVTCPIYRSYIKDFNDLVAERCCKADFLVVYIQEGHADDEWRFENAPHVIKQHVTMEHRLAASGLLKTQHHVTCNIVADCMDNKATEAYGADPMRLYIIEEGIVVYEGGPGPFEYDVKDVEVWLRERLQ